MGKYGEIIEDFYSERTRILEALAAPENRHMVMRLMLEFLRREFWFQMRAQKCHAVELVGIQPQSHPD